MKWYRKAADQGYANAQGNVGLLYENGLGVPKNPIEAQKWFRMAVTAVTAVTAARTGHW